LFKTKTPISIDKAPTKNSITHLIIL
jgi:hypothetical protein